MHERNAFCLVVSACLISAFASGCSDSPTRAANETLRKKSSEGLGLLSQAQALLENATIRNQATGETVPLKDWRVDPQNPADANAVRLAPAGTVNPKVFELLDKAERTVRGAIDEVGQDGSESVHAVATSALGRILEQKGVAHSRASEDGRAKVLASIGAFQAVYSDVVAQQGMVEYYRKLESIRPEQIEALRKEAASEVEEVSGEIAEIESDIRQLQADRKGLMDQRTRAEGEARELRSEGRTPGEEGYIALKKAADVAQRVAKLSTEIDKLDYRLQGLQSSLSEWELRERLAKKKLDAAGSMLTRRNEDRGQISASRTQLEQALSKNLQRGESLAAQTVEALRSFRDDQGKAMDVLELGLSSFKRFQSLAIDDSSQAESLCKQGDVLLLQGRAGISEMQLYDRLVEMADALKAHWDSAPEELNAESIGQQRTEVQKTAGDRFDLAASFYEQATQRISRVNRNVAWLYRAQVVNAYIGKSQALRSAEPLAKAEEELNEAMEGQETAPLVLDRVGKLRNTIEMVRSRLGGGSQS